MRCEVDVFGECGTKRGVGGGEGGVDCWRGVGYGVEEGWVGEDLSEVLFSTRLLEVCFFRAISKHDALTVCPVESAVATALQDPVSSSAPALPRPRP